MASRRREFTPQFKARVVLEVLTAARRPAQACREYGISESVLSRWRKTFLEQAPGVFEQRKAYDQCTERIAELERLVGRLTVELEIAKKPRYCWTHHGTGTGIGDEATGGYPMTSLCEMLGLPHSTYYHESDERDGQALRANGLIEALDFIYKARG